MNGISVAVGCLLFIAPLRTVLGAERLVSNMDGLEAACRNAEPGDEIVLAKGIYRITGNSRIHINSRPGPVTVRGVSGKAEDVVIEGKGQNDDSVQVIFELTGSPAWTFRDLTTRDTFCHGFKFNTSSTDCVLRNVTMRDHGESGVKGTSDPASKSFPDRLLVESCDIGFTNPSGGTRGVVEGIDGVAVRGWTIRKCRLLNIQKAGGAAYAVFTKGNSMDTVIEDNRFENCFIGASFGGGGTGANFFRDGDDQFEHRGGAIRNNQFQRTTDAAIYLNKAFSCTIEGNKMTGCALNIQLRYANDRLDQEREHERQRHRASRPAERRSELVGIGRPTER